jgi:hypothetical protein
MEIKSLFLGILFRIGIAYRFEDGAMAYVPEQEDIPQANVI